jgi:hypothetical protein
MSILNHECTEEEFEYRSDAWLKAEQKLDKVFHAIPDEIRREFHAFPINEQIQLGFKKYKNLYTNEIQSRLAEKKDKSEFLKFLQEKYKFDYVEEYWAFLQSRRKEKTS